MSVLPYLQLQPISDEISWRYLYGIGWQRKVYFPKGHIGRLKYISLKNEVKQIICMFFYSATLFIFYLLWKHQKLLNKFFLQKRRSILSAKLQINTSLKSVAQWLRLVCMHSYHRQIASRYYIVDIIPIWFPDWFPRETLAAIFAELTRQNPLQA